jgi:hypothetical protein
MINLAIFTTVIASIVYVGANYANADSTLADCRVRTITDSSIFEESLSVDEYPVVTVRKTNTGLVVKVGAYEAFKESKGDRIEIMAAGFGTLSVNFKYKDSKEAFNLTVRQARTQKIQNVGYIALIGGNPAGGVLARLNCK